MKLNLIHDCDLTNKPFTSTIDSEDLQEVEAHDSAKAIVTEKLQTFFQDHHDTLPDLIVVHRGQFAVHATVNPSTDRRIVRALNAITKDDEKFPVPAPVKRQPKAAAEPSGVEVDVDVDA